MSDRQIPLYILVGFLGSGKTTVLNTILEAYRSRSVGLIINDFGSLNIDSTLIESNEGIIQKELSGGQIFCSCLSGSFVESVAAYADLPINALFVEASGLAKPNPLMEIMHWASQTSGGAFDFRGMICIIDAERYPILSQTLTTIKEQIVYSDLFIINKSDLSDEEHLRAIEDEVSLLRPGAKIIRTSFGRFDTDLVDQMSLSEDFLRGIDPAEYKGWGKAGRPIPMALHIDGEVELTRLQEFLAQVSPKSLRIKGYLRLATDKTVLVNCVGSQILIDESIDQQSASELTRALVVILPGDSELRLSLGVVWRELTGTETVVKTG